MTKDKDIRPKRIWAVGGGKGGTGKTFLAANLGVKLAQSGKQALLIDGDLGGANLHTCLGVGHPKKTLGDFLSREEDDLNDVLVGTSLKGLSLINGSGDMLDVANLKHSQKMRFIRQFKKIDADYIVLDLGAGTGFNSLDMFISADVGILVLMPEPTSIENAYRFLKAVFYRRLRGVISLPVVRRMIDNVISNRDRFELKTPFELLKRVEGIDRQSHANIAKIIDSSKIKLVMNQVKTAEDLKIGPAMAKACKRYFGIDTEFVGNIHYDDSVGKSVRSRIPVLLEEPDSKASKEISDIFQRLNEHVS